MTDPDTFDHLLDDVDTQLGIDRLRALHVNDSAAPLGSNRDRHTNVGEGLMGEGLGAFLGHPGVQGLPALPRDTRPRRTRPGRREIQRTSGRSTRAGRAWYVLPEAANVISKKTGEL